MAESTWDINITNECADWYRDLPHDVQYAIDEAVERLAAKGPTLGRPDVAEVDNRAIHNLKELRIDLRDRGHRIAIRILFAFDPRREAILLVGGNKAEGGQWKAWYRGAIAEADRLYTRYLTDLREEGTIT